MKLRHPTRKLALEGEGQEQSISYLQQREVSILILYKTIDLVHNQFF